MKITVNYIESAKDPKKVFASISCVSENTNLCSNILHDRFGHLVSFMYTKDCDTLEEVKNEVNHILQEANVELKRQKENSRIVYESYKNEKININIDQKLQ